MPEQKPVADRSAAAYARRHLAFGWWSLLLFLSLGLVLETFHGLKIGWYLQVSSHIRRLMLTLAHTHGTLLALIHLAFAVTACRTGPSNPETVDHREPEDFPAWRRRASSCLIGASVLLPGGFFLGGFFIYDGDPGLGALLVPVGGVLLLIAVFLTARGVLSEDS